MQPIEEAMQFCRVIFAHTPRNAMIGLTDISIKPHQIRNRFYSIESIESFINDALKLQDRVNVYARITPVSEKPQKRGTEKDAIGSSVLWLDYDCYESIHNGIETLKSMSKPPTMIVMSGNGLHSYWQLNEFERDTQAIKRANIALLEQISDGFEDSCFDLARILRIPGTYNIKSDKPIMATIVYYNPDNTYNFNDFAQSQRTIDNTTVIEWENEPLPDDFLMQIKKSYKELFYRLTDEKAAITKAFAPVTNDGELDRSRNDAYVVTALLSMGFSAGVCLTALMAHNLLTGRKYAETRRYDYVVSTVNKMIRNFESSPDKFFKRNNFEVTKIGAKITNNNAPFLYTGTMLWRYENGYYQRNGTEAIRKQIADHLGTRWRSEYADEAIQWLKDKYYIEVDECNLQAGTHINVQNGMIHIETGQLSAHDPSYRCLYQIKAEFNPNVNCTALDEIIGSILPKDAVNPFWEYVGSTFLTDRYAPKAFLMLIGKKDSGKSTLLNMLVALFGIENISSQTLQSLAANRFSVVNLVGCLANIYSDLDSSEVNGSGMIKTLTGNDRSLTAEAKFERPFVFRNTARLFFSANEIPAVKGADDAYYDRAKIIICPNNFTPEKRDNTIEKRLIGLRSAALYRAYQGLQRFLAQNALSYSESMQRAREDHLMQVDTVWLFVERCTREKGNKISKTMMYQAYAQMTRNGGRHPVGETAFYRRMADLRVPFNFGDGRDEVKGIKVPYYSDIGLPDTVKTFVLSS